MLTPPYLSRTINTQQGVIIRSRQTSIIYIGGVVLRTLLLCVIFTLLFATKAQATDNSAQNWCQLGNSSATIGGQSSVLKYQQSYPQCNVLVYHHGTTSKPTIYSDADEMHVLANPFTAGTNGYWQFYVADGHYDIVLSGGILPSGVMPAPFTMSDVFITIAAGTGSVTGSGASGQCAIWDGTTSITGTSGCTFSGGSLSLSTSLKLLGSSSGTVTLQGAAAAGTWTLTLPTSGGTNGYVLTTNGSGVTSWSAAGGGSGVTSITGTANEVIASASTGAVTLSTPQAIATSSSPTFAGLTDTGAASVGTTLGVTGNATFSAAVIAAAVGPNSGQQHTLPAVTSDTVALIAATQTFTGKSMSGGSNTFTNIANASLTNSSITVSPGTGISGGGVTSLGGTVTITNSGVTALTGTASQVVVSGSTGSVTLSLPQSIATTSTPRFSALSLGGAVGAANTFKIYGSSSGAITMAGAAAAGTWSLTLPTDDGTNGQVLTTDGNGVTSWTTVSGGGSVSGSGTAGQCTFWTATSVLSGDANCLYGSGVLTLGTRLQSPTVGPNSTQQHILPAVTSDTVALLAATQTFTSKTISGSVNTFSNIGNASLTNSSLTVSPGTGMSGGGSVSLGGTITLTNAGVTSAIGTANQVVVSGSTGAVTFSLPQSIATSSSPQLAAIGLGGAAGSTNTLKLYGTSSGSTVLTATAAAGTTTITLPATTGTVALTANNLSVFAATTSAQLLGVLSDETGTGLAVFGTSPTFTTGMTLSSAGGAAVTISSLTTDASILIGADSLNTDYNIISLNGSRADTSSLGFSGGASGDNHLYFQAPATGGFAFYLGGSTATSAMIDELGTNLHRRVTANTAGSGAPKVLIASDTWSIWTNEGASAKNYYTLPTAVAGLQFGFCVQDTDGIRVVASSGDTIRLSSLVTSAAGYIEATNIGACVTLTAINATEWYGTEITGVPGWDVGS